MSRDKEMINLTVFDCLNDSTCLLIRDIKNDIRQGSRVQVYSQKRDIW